MAKAKRKTTTHPRSLLAGIAAVFGKMETLGKQNTNPLDPRKGVDAANKAALAEITDICNQVMYGGARPLSRDAANEWIDAALAAGISFDRHTSRDTREVAYRLRYSTGHAVAHAFLAAMRYGQSEMVAALEERWHSRSDFQLVQTRDLADGNFGVHHVLSETRTLLATARQLVGEGRA